MNERGEKEGLDPFSLFMKMGRTLCLLSDTSINIGSSCDRKGQLLLSLSLATSLSLFTIHFPSMDWQTPVPDIGKRSGLKT